MKKIFLSLLTILTFLTQAGAQSSSEIAAAKAVARSMGYSNDEINNAMKNYNDSQNAQQQYGQQQYGQQPYGQQQYGQYGMTPYPNQQMSNQNPAFGTIGGNVPVSGQMVPMTEVPLSPSVYPILGRKAPTSDIYGHDFFISDGLGLLPSVNAPVPESYVIGPGDEVSIDIWGASNANYTRTVGNDGSIVIQGISPLYISGMKLADAEKHIKSKLGTLYSGLKSGGTYLKVSIGKIRGVTVYVLGEVYTPGVYTLPSLTSISSAIYIAGGIMKYGSVRDIRLYRNAKLAGTFDLYDYIFKGKYDTNLRLQDGDVISVAASGNLASVGGALNRNDLKYEMKDGETVIDLINYAGGFTTAAHRDMVHIDRMNGPKGESYDVAKADFLTFPVCAGDSLFVSSNTQIYGNRVFITGSINHPGPYAISDKVSNLRQLIEIAGGVPEGTFNARGYISRRDGDMKPSSVSFSLKDVISGTQNIDLVREDSVRIFSVQELQDSVVVSVQGEVNKPGDFEFRQGLTLGDVILMAGGLTDGGDLANVEIATRGRDDAGRIRHFNLKEQPSDMDQILEPYDMVFVRTLVNYRQLQTVTINGEVKYPGTYAIEKNSVRLSDVVSRAEGFTADAYVKGAILKRVLTENDILKMETANDISKDISKDVIKDKELTAENDSTELEVKKVGDTFTIGIDLAEAVRNPGSYADIILRDGDVIDIPQMNNTVKISGGVYFPNTVAYNPSYGWRDYVHKAGGFVKGARKRKTYAIYMDGSAAVRGSAKFKMEPGMEIVVPKVSETGDRRISLAEVASLTSSISSVTYMAVLLMNLLDKK